MMQSPKGTLIVCLLLATCWLVPCVRPIAASGPQQEGKQPLKVVIKEIEPFVIEDGVRLTGFSVDVWQEVAKRIGESYEYIVVTSVGEQLQTVEQGEADIGVGAISMTAEREEFIDFSHGYYRSGLQIMVPTSGGLDLLRGIQNIAPGLLVVIGLLLLVIFAFAHLVWLFERKNNPQISRNYWRGIWECMWYSAATLTTVGYGDITPRGCVGRGFGIIWMFAGVFLIASFAASVASQVTVDRLRAPVKGVEDLVGKEVGTVQGTTSDQFLTEQRIRHLGVADLDTAAARLAEGRFDAIVFDAPVLAYYLATTDKGQFEIVGSSFDQQSYGIALPQGSEYRDRIDIALLKMFEDGTVGELREKWFGEAS